MVEKSKIPPITIFDDDADELISIAHQNVKNLIGTKLSPQISLQYSILLSNFAIAKILNNIEFSLGGLRDEIKLLGRKINEQEQ